MWIPRNAQEIIEAVTAGHLQESQVFDAKRELGTNSKETAKDIAAMANDGGVLIYGLGEDERGHVTQLAPILLKGAAEKIDQIAHTCIQEVPRIQTYVHPLPDNPEQGFLVVVVPPSERAPHMVVVNDDKRYYMRLDKTSVRMSEGEVARLYARRRQWEVNREAILDKLLTDSPYPTYLELNYLHLFVRPVSSDATLLARLGKDANARISAFKNMIGEAAASKHYPHDGSPSFRDITRSIRPTVHGIVCESDNPNRTEIQKNVESMRSYVRLDIQESGMATLFCGCTGDMIGTHKMLFAPTTVSMTLHLLMCMGIFYRTAYYTGMVDLGLAITQLKGRTVFRNFLGRFVPFPQDIYRRTLRTSALALAEDATPAARELIMPLMNEMTMGLYDPYVNP